MIVFQSAVLVITGSIAVIKHAAALFRHEKFILLQVCLTGHHLTIVNYQDLLWPFDHVNDSW